jgi:hypothetical protein
VNIRSTTKLELEINEARRSRLAKMIQDNKTEADSMTRIGCGNNSINMKQIY